jgi:hypothetical protein
LLKTAGQGLLCHVPTQLRRRSMPRAKVFDCPEERRRNVLEIFVVPGRRS